ncbi:MAG: hypothetical protein WCJ59_01585 [bacterium]
MVGLGIDIVVLFKLLGLFGESVAAPISGVISKTIEAGQSNSVTVQVKNPTPIVISTSAIITSVQTAGEYPNIIHPGQKATVYGSNLKNTGTVHILGRATEVSGLVLGGSAYDNNVFFTVPLNLPDGDYIIDVQDINGVRSNTLYNVKVVNVTLTTPVTMSVNPSITVLSPNGGESIVYENLYMAGDLGFSWKSSDEVNYAPTSNLKVSLVNANGVVVREEFKRYYQTTNLGNGVYHASFTGQNNITPNNRYKIKICDLLTNSVTDVCDVSDNYFTITDSVSTQSSITVGSNNTASALIGFDQVVKLIQALMK